MSPTQSNNPLTLLGPTALVATMTVPRERTKDGPSWQYHSRSDHHSKVTCLLMQLDLMLVSPALREDVAAARVACGINHVMQDHSSNRKKAFDLVLHRPDALDRSSPRTTFQHLLSKYGVVLTRDQMEQVLELPDVPVRSVPANGVYVAWEAKAAMTAFSKARPRLFDELNSAHLTIHGDTPSAIAAGVVMINTADTFISPILNRGGATSSAGNPIVTRHRQPKDFVSVLRKVDELPRRPGASAGFDALGIVAVECHNDNTPIPLMTSGVLQADLDDADFETLKNFDYGRMIRRVAHLYETQFHR